MLKRQKVFSGGDMPALVSLSPNIQMINKNCLEDFEVSMPPADTVSSMAFSPPSMMQMILVAGAWDKSVRCWEVESSGKSVPKTIQCLQSPILDVCWADDGSKVLASCSDGSVMCWDLNTNQTMTIGGHAAPVKTCHWIRAPSYSCLMTGSWDRTLKFWDMRSPQAIKTICLPERCYCCDVDYPMAVVGTADKSLIVYLLEAGPQEFSRVKYPLKLQMRCLSIFKDKERKPSGFAVGGIEGRVSVQCINQPLNSFTFKCHRSDSLSGFQEIYAVNDIAFHPIHGTFATVGSDGRYIFWDKEAKKKRMQSQPAEQPITTCSFSSNGHIFAYSVGYDWSKGYEYNQPNSKKTIYLRNCFDDLKPTICHSY